MIKLGTSGFSYDDWVGPVYPQGTAQSEYLGVPVEGPYKPEWYRY